MSYKIGQTFNTWKLLKFAFPTIIMMMIMSLYTIVDGMFVSRFVGTDALSAINIVYPIMNIIMAVAIMLANGGSAIIANKIGAGNIKEAKQDFTFIILLGVLFCIVFSGICIFFSDPLIQFLGATEKLIPYCQDYLIVNLIFSIAYMLQLLFGVFFVTAGVPLLGCILTVLSGISNIILDYVLIVLLDIGIKGAAYGTVASWLIPTIIGIIYFSNSKHELHFTSFFKRDIPKKQTSSSCKNNANQYACKDNTSQHTSLLPRLFHMITSYLDWNMVKEACFNGSSEMVTNLSTAVITILFNLLAIQYLGEHGVAAITIVLYAQFLFTAIYLGFSGGVAPVISYNLGSNNRYQLKRLYYICLRFIIISSLILFVISMFSAPFLISFFTPKGSATYEITITGFYLYGFTYLFAGINIFASSYFTALSNGVVSAIISFLRTFGFLLACLLILPNIIGADGIWIATPIAEVFTIFVSFYYFRKQNISIFEEVLS